MSRIRTLIAGLVLMVAPLGYVPATLAEECSRQRFAESDFIVCTIDPATEDLRLFWQDDEGAPYRTFSAVADRFAESDQTLALAINAGMYGEDYAPIGLYTENGDEKRPVNTRTVDGPPAAVPNFYKKPNGVFFIDGDGAGILDTQIFVAKQRDIEFATQSGPLLVQDNVLHSALIDGSTDRTRRSGIGVCENGIVRLAVSDGVVNFHDFARLFRDQLECPDALFLDGGRGVGLYYPPLRRNDFSWHGGYGPMLGVVK
ncbi:phosphodiester glycosidase family protein [Pelagibacterium sp.]|uniref:phosphodiester glycosidase family protein n=1 Tax=Pelagibacterium sp. TaxID=1967288 RepID=UPI003A914505